MDQDIQMPPSTFPLSSLQFIPHYVPEPPEGGFVDILVIRSFGTSGSAIVSYEVTGTGSAIPGLDIQPATGTLVFSDGETSKNLRLEILPDMVRLG